jgi:hypothetical protein
MSLHERSEELGQFPGRVYEHIRRALRQRMRGKAVIDAYRPQAGIASSFDIDLGVADDGGFFWANMVLVE